MSEENVEIIRRCYAGITESGNPDWTLFSTDFEFDASGVMPDTPPGQGREAASPLFRTYFEMFENFELRFEELIASGEDQVVTAVRDGGRVKGSDAQVWNHFFHVFTFREGKIIRWSSHLDRDSALEDAGLSE